MMMMILVYVRLVGVRSAVCVMYHDRDRKLLHGDASRLWATNLCQHYSRRRSHLLHAT